MKLEGFPKAFDFTKSGDGELRTSIGFTVRLTSSELDDILGSCERYDGRRDKKAVQLFLKACLERGIQDALQNDEQFLRIGDECA